MATILISIKPRYVKKILNGSKIYELRKRSSGIKQGDRLVIYSTSPDRCVLATCCIKRVVIGKPTSVYEKVNGSAGVGKREFDSYFAGESHAYAFELEDVKRLSRPVYLEEIRQNLCSFVVPQSYRRLRSGEIRGIDTP